MKIPPNQLSARLEKSLLPCYLVSGDEPLLVQEALDAIRAAARAAGYGSRERFVAATGFDWQELTAAGGNLSLFAEKRILDLSLPTGKPGKQGAAAIIDTVAQAGDDLLLLVAAPKLDRNNAAAKWVKALDASGAVVQVWPVARRELPAWIGARMRALDLNADRDAVQLVADRVEGNLLAAQQEIEKLRLLLGPGTVSAAQVNRAVADSSRFDVYKLVDAAVGGDAPRALRILDGVHAEGIDAVIVMWALARELRSLARLADSVGRGTELGAAMHKCGVWRGRQDLVRACVGRHRGADFYRLLQAVRRADAAAKGQQGGDPWQLATEIVLALAGDRALAA
ncbi:MAG TPA: DNA polymerase III subunit delta [Woeseiaceae bacterium]|nr:DNA polymerase III subunit delta [Woeseiaceae bacterium]